MQPVKPESDLERLIESASLLLLCRDTCGIRYVQQHLAFKTANVKSKGGRTLPIEVWNMILGTASADITDSCCFVQLISLRNELEVITLRCRAIKWCQGTRRFGCIRSSSEIHDYEEFLQKPNEENCERVNMPLIEPADGDENTFDVLLTSADSHLPIELESLFTNLTVPDMICWMEDGECNLCMGDRKFCPGCTGGRAQEFDAFMGCGVALACPLCMGLDFCLDHKIFLQKYYFDVAPEEERQAMDDLIVQRLNKFNY